MQKYQIISAIGEGAYGIVLKCKDIESNCYVAIKKFKETDEQAHTKKTTIRQVKLLKMASHPNIVELKEAFRKKGIVYLVFQYLQSNLLQVLQKSPKGLPLPFIRSIIFQLLKGLAYLHEQNIVHRDIKPENLLVSRQQRLKICDFGFARQIVPQKKDQNLTDYVATRWYRPPELLVGGEYGKEIDLWAVGCIMCELIDGNPLFSGENQLDQLFLIQKSMGALSSELKERFANNKQFQGMKFPDIQHLDKIQKRYLGKICSKALSLINGLLKMDPKQRISAAQALKHPFFNQQKQSHAQISLTNRIEAYTAASSTKKQVQNSSGLTQKLKSGKIYKKRRKGFETVCQIYQSSKNCKLSNLAVKSLLKPEKKYTQNKQFSLQKHRKIHLLTKTQARGFYIDSMDQKLSGYGDFSKKSTEIGSVQSNKQLPFLIYNQQTFGSDSLVKNDKVCASKDKCPTKKNGLLLHRQTFNIKQLVSHK